MRARTAAAAVLCMVVPAVAAPSEDPCRPATDQVDLYRQTLEFNAKVRLGELKPGWIPGEDAFWFAAGAPSATVIHKVDAGLNTASPLLDTPRLRQALAAALGHELPYSGLPFESVSFVSARRVRFAVGNRTFELDLDTYALTDVPQPSEEERKRRAPQQIREGFTAGSPSVMEAMSSDGRWFATEKENDLWLRSAADGRAERITRDGEEDLSWSVEGAKWHPDSYRIALTRVDTRGLDRVPVVHWLKPVEDVDWFPYTKAGGRMATTEIHVVDVIARKSVLVEGSGLADHHYWILGWREDGSEILFLRMNRVFQKLDLLAADARTGKSRTILEETSDTFIGALRFYVTTWATAMTPLGDGKRFVWLSERDGWPHLYLYRYDGTLEQRLTQGEFPVLGVAGVDLDGGWVYFTAHGEPAPYDTHLYRVNLAGKRFARLTEGDGQHQAVFSPSKRYFLDTHSSLFRPPRHDLRKADGTFLRTVAEADTSGVAALRLTPPEEFVAKAADGKTDLHGVLFKPPDFDPTRRYPVLDAIYNGPFITWVPRTFLAGRAVMPRALAQLGFVVLVVDGRGTPERGRAFQDVVYRRFGGHEIPDHAAVLEGLAATRPWMDRGRVGIFGGSWGGYMTMRALLTHPETYHVGVAVNGVADLYDHASVSIEGYMGLPKDNREGYEQASNILLADRLKGKLLLMHGTSDVNATFSATMKMVAALIDAGKPHDLVVLPESSHRPMGDNLTYYMEKQWAYFAEHLDPGCVVPAARAIFLPRRPVTRRLRNAWTSPHPVSRRSSSSRIRRAAGSPSWGVRKAGRAPRP